MLLKKSCTRIMGYALIIAAVSALFITRHVQNKDFQRAKEYGEAYGTALIAKIQNGSDVEFTAQKTSYNHKSIWVVGSASKLQPARYPSGTTLIPSVDSTDEMIQTIRSSLKFEQVQVVDIASDTETPDGEFWGTLTFYMNDESDSGISFDLSFGLLRLKIQDETKDHHLILLFEADPEATDYLFQVLSDNG